MNNLKQFPKIELHIHLDGSVMLETASSILSKNIDEIRNDMVASFKCENLTDYLTKFELPISIMQTKEQLEKISFELANNLVDDGVIYAEIRFAPINHLSKGLTLDEVVDSVLCGLRKVNLKTNLILCMMRNSSYEENKSIIDLATRYLNKGVVAIDLAGDEYKYKTNSFKDLFSYAKSLKVPFTIHAGEADGISSIKAALDFGARRLGHGIRCTEDNNLVNEIKTNNVLLEVCPTSNMQTRVVDSMEKHPIKYLYDQGVDVCINTDNRTVSNITLTSEYEKIVKQFNFSFEDLKNMNLNAIKSSFLSTKEKEELQKNYLDKYEEFIKKN